MSRLTSSLVAAAVLGQLVGLLGYVDPIFVVLVLVAPLVVGAVAAAASVRYAWVAVLWCSAGLNMALLDQVLLHEDLAFHLALSVVMPLIAGAGYGMVRLARRGRAKAVAG